MESDNINRTAPESSKRKLKKPAPQQDGMISFVAFDGSSSDASRKAVRKQAALASAAARKETIARKIAKQKEQDDELRRRGVVQGCAVPTTLPTSGSTKRKRESNVLQEQWDNTTTTIPLHEHETIEHGQRKKPQPRIVSAYLNAPSSTKESPLDDATQLLTPAASPLSTTASLLASSTEIPFSFSRHIMPLKHNTLAMLSDDYDWREESNLPPTPESLASPKSSGASLFDPFAQYPVPYHPVYDRLLHHMLTIYAPRGWPALSITNKQGLAWEHFMTQHALAEPALFLVRCMFASGDLISLGVLESSVVSALRSLAIKAINEALLDSDRSISDGLILAVGRIALTESLYGDRNAANTTHRPAQRRMIDLRGGMAALDFPPLVKRLMRWADRVMSIQSSTARLLPDDEELGVATFDVKQSVSVLEHWAPQQGRALRRKIAIADLIT